MTVLYFSAVAIFQALVERFAFLDYANCLQDIGYLFGLNYDCLALCLASPSMAANSSLENHLAFPHFYEPCLPSPADNPPAGAGWLHEIKHDGFRIIARKNGEQVRPIGILRFRTLPPLP